MLCAHKAVYCAQAHTHVRNARNARLGLQVAATGRSVVCHEKALSSAGSCRVSERIHRCARRVEGRPVRRLLHIFIAECHLRRGVFFYS
eukprot:4510734-Prymnesium_polylepis.1